MRTSTWINLGVNASTNDFDKLMQESGLDYNVVARDMKVEHAGKEIIIPGRKMIMREDTEDMFGIVSDRYQICQNRDALDFVKHINDLELIKAGSTSSGYVYMIGQLPEMSVLGDTIRPHLIFQNSHDGSASVRATICMLRLVCQNQFVGTFANSPATVSVSHYGNVDEKLTIAKDTMVSTYEYIKNYEATATALATQKVTPKLFNQILENFFKIKEDYSERKIIKIENDRDLFLKAYEADDNGNFRGTKWGMVNAYSDYLTHYEPSRKSAAWEEKRFMWNLNPAYMDQFIEALNVA